MKPYRDVFGNPLPKRDVVAATRLIVQMNKATTSLLTRRLAWGYGKALETLLLLEDAGVVSLLNGSQGRSVILRNEDAAINAALRQLRKGKRG